MRRLKFALSALAVVADVDSSMPKTRVILENIFLVLLNLIKRSIFVIIKDFSPNIHANKIHFFSLVHLLRMLSP